MSDLPPVERFETSNGIHIYRIPMILFPNGFVGYAHLVVGLDVITLVDCGSGFGRSNDDLLAGIASIQETFDVAISPKDIQRILVTHGHIDHFGGVAFMKEQAPQAEIGIHELDRRVLTAYEERVIVATKDLAIFLQRAGVKPSLQDTLMEMYGFMKQHVNSVEVDMRLDDHMELDGMRFYHTPGHCSGQVCIQIDDILLSADHILSRTTPHQAPESITQYTGLGHYLEALQKISRVDNIRLALGGHEDTIEGVYERIGEIQASHLRKLDRVRNTIQDNNDPMTISDISKSMYPDKHNYEILLALEEVGAHVEYLYQHGQLSIANLDEVEQEDNPALQYVIA